MTIALRPKTRHFQTHLEQLVFKLKRRMVLVDLFSKVETGFLSEKTHLSFAVRENLKNRLNCQKIAPEIGRHTKMAYFCPFLNAKSESLHLLYPLTFRLKLKIQPSSSKSRAWKLKFYLQEIRKVSFINPSGLIWPLSSLIQAISRHARIRICRVTGYE